ncbi:MAG: hypothetical protein ABJD23_00505 [Nonlabens sp.]
MRTWYHLTTQTVSNIDMKYVDISLSRKRNFQTTSSPNNYLFPQLSPVQNRVLNLHHQLLRT